MVMAMIKIEPVMTCILAKATGMNRIAPAFILANFITSFAGIKD